MAIGAAATIVLAAAVVAAAFGSRPKKKRFADPPRFDLLGTHQNVVVIHNPAAVYAFNERPEFYPMLVANQQGGTDADWETMTEWMAAVAESRPDVTFGIVPIEVILEMHGTSPTPGVAVVLAYAPSRYDLTHMAIDPGLDDYVAEQAIAQMLAGGA